MEFGNIAGPGRHDKIHHAHDSSPQSFATQASGNPRIVGIAHQEGARPLVHRITAD